MFESFKSFDLVAAIRLENRRRSGLKKAVIPEDRTFGMMSLQPDVLRFPLETAESAAGLANCYCGFSDEDTAENLDDLFVEACTAQDTHVALGRLKSLIARLSERKAALKKQDWYASQASSLRKGDVWRRMQNQAATKQARQSIIDLEQQYKEGCDYSDFHTHALIHLDLLLGGLRYYHGFAQLEIWHRKRRLPRSARASYRSYLDAFNEGIVEEQKRIHANMLSRLENAFKHRNLSDDDMIQGVMSNVLGVGGCARETQAPGPRCDLDARVLHYFQRSICLHGTAADREALLQSPWCSSAGLVKTGQRSCRGRVFLIMEEFDREIPYENRLWRWFSRLSRGRRIRFKLFQTQEAQYLLAALKYQPDIKLRALADFERPRVVRAQIHYERLKSVISRECKRVTDLKSSLSPRLHRKTLNTLDTYHAVLSQWQRGLSSKQRALFDRMEALIATSQTPVVEELTVDGYQRFLQLQRHVRVPTPQSEQHSCGASCEQICQQLGMSPATQEGADASETNSEEVARCRVFATQLANGQPSDDKMLKRLLRSEDTFVTAELKRVMQQIPERLTTLFAGAPWDVIQRDERRSHIMQVLCFSRLWFAIQVASDLETQSFQWADPFERYLKRYLEHLADRHFGWDDFCEEQDLFTTMTTLVQRHIPEEAPLAKKFQRLKTLNVPHRWQLFQGTCDITAYGIGTVVPRVVSSPPAAVCGGTT